ncbi:MAG: hypothetical protein RR137_09035 [Odoribacter sp.]
MKIKNILILIPTLWLWNACTPDDVPVYPNPVNTEDIKYILLTSDHKTLLPDGKAQMEFRCKALGMKITDMMKKYETADSVSYYMEVDTLFYEIPADQLPVDYITVYDESGRKVDKNIFSTTSQSPKIHKFYAKGGNIVSNTLEITIRDLPNEDEYAEIIYPVIFHLLVPPASNRPAYTISVEKLQETLDRMNNILNGKVSHNPNGGNAKIMFQLAEYDPKGRLLAEKGKEVLNLSSDMNKSQYLTYINGKKMWDSQRYLNIFIAKFSDRWSSSGSESYIVKPPSVILKGVDMIPGFSMKKVTSFHHTDVKDFTEVALLLNYGEFFNPSLWNSNDALELSTVMGEFMGLLGMEYKKKWSNVEQDWVDNIVDGDSDYCPDTYVYEPAGNYSIYKKDYFSDEYFTTFNIMAAYSRKNSVTVDQIRRMRAVIERCPSRWSYKSSWAFNGKHD